jgi:hypothetical protein
MRGLIAALAVALALAAPTAALAQGSPFTPLPPAPTQTPPAPAPAPSSSSSGSGGLSGWQSTLIYVGAALLLGGIGLMILLDAREKTRTLKSRTAAGPEDTSARDPHRERAKQQARRKQKAARAQRRRNR